MLCCFPNKNNSRLQRVYTTISFQIRLGKGCTRSFEEVSYVAFLGGKTWQTDLVVLNNFLDLSYSTVLDIGHIFPSFG